MTSSRLAPNPLAGLRPTVPDGLWERSDMATALAERDMGTVLKIFRRWTGLSQSRVSALVDIPQSHISEMERGVRRATGFRLYERLVVGLGIPPHLLAFTPASIPTRTPRGTADRRHNSRIYTRILGPATSTGVTA